MPVVPKNKNRCFREENLMNFDASVPALVGILCSPQLKPKKKKWERIGLILFLCSFAALLPVSFVAHAQVAFTIDRFEVTGDNPLSQNATQAILKPFLGDQTGIERLREAASTLETTLNGRGFRFHRVTLPPQVLEGGSVVLEVRSLVIGSITASGNKHFSDSNVRRSLPQLVEGKTPNTRALSRALAVANFNTAKRTRLTFGRGSEPNTLDARIDVRDRKPQQLYTWLNNTGSPQTSRSRIGLGYQHRNLFDRDHNLTATYTTSPEKPDQVSQFGVNYEIPIYRTTGTLGLFYIDSDVETGRVAEFFDVNSGGEVAGIRYSQILNKWNDYRQRIYVDLSNKIFDNDVDFIGTEVGVDVASRPLSVSWQLEWDRLSSTGRFNAAYASNLSGGSLNTDEAYAASRVGAPQDWDAIRINYSHEFNLPKELSLVFNTNLQYADDPLISGEQLGLGGSLGPRGFEEREVGVDRGASLKLELWSPGLSRGFQVGSFVDYGFGDRINAQEGEEANRSLTSVGLSAKWQWGNRLSSRIDFGHVLAGLDREPTLTQDGDNRFHFSLVYKLLGE